MYVALAVLILAAVAVATPMLKRNNRLDEVDRFHVARTLTTSWSGQVTAPDPAPERGEPAEQD